MEKESLNKGISVIIPCYYKWAFVEECLESVFQQKNVNTQVICVHNNSDAQLLDKLTKLERQHMITLIDNGRANLGVAYARNCGLERVTADTVMFLDDDDRIGWKHTQKEIQKDIFYMDTDSFLTMSFYMLTCFDANNDDAIETASKKYLNYYAPVVNTLRPINATAKEAAAKLLSTIL